MGKIRVSKLGDEHSEQEQKRRAEARRETKKSKKQKVSGVGLKGGERTALVEGTDIKPEYKKLIEEVEKGEAPGVKKSKKKKSAAGQPKQKSKKYRDALAMFDRSKQYPLQEAVELVKKTSYSKFDGSVEIHINLNPLALGDKTDFRGTVSLPHGTGKQVKVIEATEAVIAAIEAGKIEFDILVARPSMMSKLARVAKILGPRGLMPNPKTGTVTDEIDKRIKELSSGKVNYKTEPNNPIIHLHIGKVSFEEDKLSANIAAVIESVGRGKITKATLAATMGPGIRLQV